MRPRCYVTSSTCGERGDNGPGEPKPLPFWASISRLGNAKGGQRWFLPLLWVLLEKQKPGFPRCPTVSRVSLMDCLPKVLWSTPSLRTPC
jgi:hypothetical protein